MFRCFRVKKKKILDAIVSIAQVLSKSNIKNCSFYKNWKMCCSPHVKNME